MQTTSFRFLELVLEFYGQLLYNNYTIKYRNDRIYFILMVNWEVVFVGVRIKTGEIATASLGVDIFYRCSSCGRNNSTVSAITASAYTGTILGVNLDRNLYSHAQNALQKKLATVLDQNNAQRFRAARFTCECKGCGHVEPWARMNYNHLEAPNSISLGILIFSVFVLAFALTVQPFNGVHFFFFALLVSSAATRICISLYKAKNNEKMERLIAALPPESLPTILLHSNES